MGNLWKSEIWRTKFSVLFYRLVFNKIVIVQLFFETLKQSNAAQYTYIYSVIIADISYDILYRAHWSLYTIITPLSFESFYKRLKKTVTEHFRQFYGDIMINSELRGRGKQ